MLMGFGCFWLGFWGFSGFLMILLGFFGEVWVWNLPLWCSYKCLVFKILNRVL